MRAVDPECDIAVATMAQLLLQQGKIDRALEYFRRAAELSRTEAEIVNALSFAEAAQTQLEVSVYRVPKELGLCHELTGVSRYNNAIRRLLHRLPWAKSAAVGA